LFPLQRKIGRVFIYFFLMFMFLEIFSSSDWIFFFLFSTLCPPYLAMCVFGQFRSNEKFVQFEREVGIVVTVRSIFFYLLLLRECNKCVCYLFCSDLILGGLRMTLTTNLGRVPSTRKAGAVEKMKIQGRQPLPKLNNNLPWTVWMWPSTAPVSKRLEECL
jgi:hypothetical protein